MQKIKHYFRLKRLVKKMKGMAQEHVVKHASWEVNALHLAAQIRQARKQLKLSREALSQRSQVNLHYIYQAEEAPGTLNIQVLRQIVEEGLGGNLQMGVSFIPQREAASATPRMP